jgi:hypothetical protein
MSSASSEIAFLARALKMPRIPKAAKLFAERARSKGWDYEAFLALCSRRKPTSAR